VDRREKILQHIDVATQRGLEIGPLHHPFVTRDEGEVFYVDHADTEALRAKYEGHDDVVDIVDVDFVWGDGTLAEAVGSAAPFDYVIASHVVEHTPDLVGWLRQIADVLVPGGMLGLVVPDKRFCFDRRRSTTELPAVVAAHLEGRTRHTLESIFDFYLHIATADTAALWRREHPDPDEPLHFDTAIEFCEKAAASGEYVDVHSWTFTPRTFVAVLDGLFELDLLPFRFASFHPTPPFDLEFICTLERLGDDLAAAERRELQRRSLPTVDDGFEALDDSAPPPGTVPMLVSPKEASLLERKRRVLTAARSGLAAVRRRRRV
jgi:SAM-dependent methyltransferase